MFLLQLHHGQPGHVHCPADAVQQDVRDGPQQVGEEDKKQNKKYHFDHFSEGWTS